RVAGRGGRRRGVVAVDGRGSKAAETVMVAEVDSSEPQMLAAAWNALSRCAPRVVPGLPPTGATGVGSLNPSPGPSTLVTTTVADRADVVSRKTRPAAVRTQGRRG